MHRLSAAASLPAVIVILIITTCLSSCRPEQTPTRVIVKFMQAVGCQDFESARQYVTPDSAGEVENWHALLIFPDVSNPPTEKEEKNIGTFIGALYRFFETEVTESEATIRVTFFATDALIRFPTVADDPLTPVSAPFEVKLVRLPESDSSEDNPDLGPWLISEWYPIPG